MHGPDGVQLNMCNAGNEGFRCVASGSSGNMETASDSSTRRCLAHFCLMATV
jgi:hypothetical protein